MLYVIGFGFLIFVYFFIKVYAEGFDPFHWMYQFIIIHFYNKLKLTIFIALGVGLFMIIDYLNIKNIFKKNVIFWNKFIEKVMVINIVV